MAAFRLTKAALLACTALAQEDDAQVLVQVGIDQRDPGSATEEMWKRYRQKEGWLKTEEPKDTKLRKKEKEDENYGFPECQCIGVSGIEGTMEVSVNASGKETKVEYPRDMGSRCEQWDKGRHPDCEGGGNDDWCYSNWCYVDPCQCDIAVLPKLSNYLEGGTYRGRGMYYSYTTCNNKDPWTAENNLAACVNQKTEKDCNEKTEEKDCVWNGGRCMGAELNGICEVNADEAVVGKAECQCIGVAGRKGTSEVEINGEKVEFPADIGSGCNAWEDKRHPECKGDKSPEWCSQKWCYVDPCTCGLEAPPKTSSYFPDANIQGRKIYYSYETCGDGDEFTSTRNESCVQFESESDCSLDKCAWSEHAERCLGKELAKDCEFGKEDGKESEAKSVAPRARALAVVATIVMGLASFAHYA